MSSTSTPFDPFAGLPPGPAAFEAGRVLPRRHVNEALRVTYRRGIFRREAGPWLARRTVLCFCTETGRREHGYEDRREGGLFLYYSKGRGHMALRAENRHLFEQAGAGDDLLAFSDAGLPPGDTRCLGFFDCHRFRFPVATRFPEPAVVFELTPRDPAAFAALPLSEECSDLARRGGWTRHPTAP